MLVNELGQFVKLRSAQSLQRIRDYVLSRLSSSGTACPLICSCLRDWSYNKGLHPGFGVVGILLVETRVNNITNTVDRKTCFCNVGS